MNTPLLIPKTVARSLFQQVCGHLASQNSEEVAKDIFVEWLYFCLPCLPRTFIALKLELNGSILKTRLRRLMIVHYGYSSFHSGHSVSFWSLMNPNLVWTFIFYPLQIFYPWDCFSLSTKLGDDYFEFLSIALFCISSYKENCFHCTMVLL